MNSSKRHVSSLIIGALHLLYKYKVESINLVIHIAQHKAERENKKLDLGILTLLFGLQERGKFNKRERLFWRLLVIVSRVVYIYRKAEIGEVRHRTDMTTKR